MKLKNLVVTISLCTAAVLPPVATAGSWAPDRPVKVIVAFPAGGDTDVSARIYSEQLSKKFDVPFVVENRTGASGVIGASFVAGAKADGHTLLYTNNTLVIAPHMMNLQGAAKYDPNDSFSPIVRDQTISMVLAASKKSGIESVADILKMHKEGLKLQAAVPGTGTPMHIAGELLNESAGIDVVHIPYRGSAPAVADAVSGHVPLVWASPGVLGQYFKSGDLVPLALADDERSSLLPDVPTLKELGYDEVVVTAWQGIVGPKGLPQEIIDGIYETVKTAGAEPETIKRFEGLGIQVNVVDAEAFKQQIANEYQVYGELLEKYSVADKK